MRQTKQTFLSSVKSRLQAFFCNVGQTSGTKWHAEIVKLHNRFDIVQYCKCLLLLWKQQTQYWVRTQSRQGLLFFSKGTRYSYMTIHTCCASRFPKCLATGALKAPPYLGAHGVGLIKVGALFSGWAASYAGSGRLVFIVAWNCTESSLSAAGRRRSAVCRVQNTLNTETAVWNVKVNSDGKILPISIIKHCAWRSISPDIH